MVVAFVGGVCRSSEQPAGGAARRRAGSDRSRRAAPAARRRREETTVPKKRTTDLKKQRSSSCKPAPRGGLAVRALAVAARAAARCCHAAATAQPHAPTQALGSRSETAGGWGSSHQILDHHQLTMHDARRRRCPGAAPLVALLVRVLEVADVVHHRARKLLRRVAPAHVRRPDLPRAQHREHGVLRGLGRDGARAQPPGVGRREETQRAGGVGGRR